MSLWRTVSIQKRLQQYVGVALSVFALHLLFIPCAQGATADEFHVQIDALMKQIASLQRELFLQSSAPPAALSGPTQVVFTRNLWLGSAGNDVLKLQTVLNLDTRTRVRESGAGSPGDETTYFGSATKVAVVKFQELYAQEILIPSGILRGNGFVGEKTRGKLNVIFASGAATKKTISKNIPPEVDTSKLPHSTLLQNSDAVSISGLHTVSVKRGGSLTVFGSGYDALKNTLYVGGKVLENVPSINGSALTFTVPLDLPIDTHYLRVKNAQGKESNSMLFIVTKDDSTPPVIETLTPEEGHYGQKITILGENFSLKGNDILSSYAIIEDIPSPDGTTLTFEILPFPAILEANVGADLKKSFELPIYFYVVNENGISNELSPGKFVLKI